MGVCPCVHSALSDIQTKLQHFSSFFLQLIGELQMCEGQQTKVRYLPPKHTHSFHLFSNNDDLYNIFSFLSVVHKMLQLKLRMNDKAHKFKVVCKNKYIDR